MLQPYFNGEEVNLDERQWPQVPQIVMAERAEWEK